MVWGRRMRRSSPGGNFAKTCRATDSGPTIVEMGMEVVLTV